MLNCRANVSGLWPSAVDVEGSTFKKELKMADGKILCSKSKALYLSLAEFNFLEKNERMKWVSIDPQ